MREKGRNHHAHVFQHLNIFISKVRVQDQFEKENFQREKPLVFF